ncbi:hypothetical protein BGZ94_006725, partial [Podila epigama]
SSSASACAAIRSAAVVADVVEIFESLYWIGSGTVAVDDVGDDDVVSVVVAVVEVEGSEELEDVEGVLSIEVWHVKPDEVNAVEEEAGRGAAADK